MLTTHRKGLAGWTARNQVKGALIDTEIYMPDVALDQIPTSDAFRTSGLVVSDCVAAIAVPLDYSLWSKTGLMEAYPKTTGSRKKFD
jgi:hypothetical protein